MKLLIVNILKALTGAPYWVWIVFFGLLWMGIKRIKEQVVSLPKLFLMPCLLIFLRFVFLVHKSTVLILWGVLSVLIGMFIGSILASHKGVKIDRSRHAICFPGSYVPLILMMLFFWLQFFSGYFQAIDSPVFANYVVYDVILTSLISGYFLGGAVFSLYGLIKFNKKHCS